MEGGASRAAIAREHGQCIRQPRTRLSKREKRLRLPRATLDLPPDTWDTRSAMGRGQGRGWAHAGPLARHTDQKARPGAGGGGGGPGEQPLRSPVREKRSSARPPAAAPIGIKLKSKLLSYLGKPIGARRARGPDGKGGSNTAAPSPASSRVAAGGPTRRRRAGTRDGNFSRFHYPETLCQTKGHLCQSHYPAPVPN